MLFAVKMVLKYLNLRENTYFSLVNVTCNGQTSGTGCPTSVSLALTLLQPKGGSLEGVVVYLGGCDSPERTKFLWNY